MNILSSGRQRGFALIDGLMAMLVLAFGMLVLAGLQMALSRNADVAKQRTEAMRLAEERIEGLRAYTSIAPGAGLVAWDSLADSTDTVVTNTTYTRVATLGGSTADPMRRAQVLVSWTDRTGGAQSVLLTSVISKTDPADSGSLGFPLPANTTLKRPMNRNLNIPVPALDLGNGKSVYNFPGSDFAVVFTNDSGYVVQKCLFHVDDEADLAGCTTYDAYILAGYVSKTMTSFPSTLGINTALLTGYDASGGVSCTFGDAIDQNTSAVIAGYKYYLCIVSVVPNTTWSGTVRLRGIPTEGTGSDPAYMVCRFQYPATAGISANQRNVQPYASVGESLDSQNYVVTTESSCPTISGVTTTLHQNCRFRSPNSNANRATDCPAS